nr:MAG TPA: hypothetical protein [Caudoviricetes sp.]
MKEGTRSTYPLPRGLNLYHFILFSPSFIRILNDCNIKQ